MFIKYFKIISSVFSKLFGEKRFVNSVKVFPLNIKSINPIKKYPHITESYACTLKLKMFVLMFLFLINAFRNMFYPKTIKISNIIIIHMQNNPMSSNIRILVKISYICLSFIFCKLSREKTPLNIGSFSYFWISKLVKGWGGIKNLFYYYYAKQ